MTTDHLAPDVSIQVPGRQDVLERGGLNVRVLCGEACSVEATLAATGGSDEAVAPRTTERSRAGAIDLSLELSSEAQNALRERLAAGETVVFEVRADARDAAGNRATATRRVGLAPTL